MVVGEFTQETDFLVIGGGPGGYSAAFRAAELGLSTIIVDDNEQLGGVCLHRGCIPSKTLLHIAEVIETGAHAAQFGVHFESPRVDLAAVRNWVEQARAALGKGLASLVKKHGIEQITGRATFENSRNVHITGNGGNARIRFRRALIATGSSAAPHPAMPFDGKRVLTPEQAVDIQSIPQRLLIVGHSYMAVELASIYTALGSHATVIDECDRLVPDADADLARHLLRRLESRIAHVGCGATIKDARVDDDGVHITFAGDRAPAAQRFDRVIVAIGQRANTANLGLERTQVRLGTDGFIAVNEQLRTDDPRIFAAGDVTGSPLLADHAMLQGRIAAEVAAGWNSSIDRRAIAYVVFTNPQLAWCGLTEAQAAANDIPHEIVKLPWGASGRAVGMGRTDGLTKIIYDTDTKLVLGVGIVGSGAAELISEAVLAIEMGAVLDDLAGAIHPHPTLSELISDAARRVERP